MKKLLADVLLVYWKKVPFGSVGVIESKGCIVRIILKNYEIKNNYFDLPNVVKIFFTELDEYLTHKRKDFSVEYQISGTDFQKRVLSAISKIPYGNFESYKKIAEIAQCIKGYRAIGNACGKNPVPLLIPCHRVIRANGETGGFSADILIKRWLINHEKRILFWD